MHTPHEFMLTPHEFLLTFDDDVSDGHSAQRDVLDMSEFTVASPTFLENEGWRNMLSDDSRDGSANNSTENFNP